jgi:hypothetical protein
MTGLGGGEDGIRTVGATGNFLPRIAPRIGELFGAIILNTFPESMFAFGSASPPVKEDPTAILTQLKTCPGVFKAEDCSSARR